MEPIARARLNQPPAETPDRERLDEIDRCFECGTVFGPDAHGSTVAEGIVLCAACCARGKEAADADAEPDTVRLPRSWYEDLSGETHHT